MANGKDYVKTAVPVLAGAGMGVIADKLVAETFGKTGIPNPQYESIQVHDVILAGAELFGAFLLRKKPMARDFLIGMASSIVVTDVLEKVQTTGSWLKASASTPGAYAGPVTPKASGIAQPVSPQGSLLVGSPGGGHVVYKPNVTPTYAGSNVGANNLFI